MKAMTLHEIMKINIFQHNSNLLLRWTFSLTPEEAMVDDLAKTSDTEKITVLFSENPDLVSYIYIYIYIYMCVCVCVCVCVKQNEKHPWIKSFFYKALVWNSHIPKLCQNDRSETYQGCSETSHVNHNILFHVIELNKN